MCAILVVAAAGLVWAMETWRPVLEPAVKILDAFAMRGRLAYEPFHYRLWEVVTIGSTAAVVGLGIWSLFGQNPDPLLDAHLQAKLDTQAREHARRVGD
ncbi:hypothetical protein [Caulobacter sp. DWP3-1-3b2]|uniref:hypothetical protein n=1 Tax=Caulobacter sp. DWP3-1-3b2 TaxID=2804643 RepID=UPI003CF1B4F9